MTPLNQFECFIIIIIISLLSSIIALLFLCSLKSFGIVFPILIYLLIVRNEYNSALSSHFCRKLFVQNRRHLFGLCNYIDIDRLITINWNMM